MMGLRFGSLFSGVGGFDMGLEAAGMTPAWQVEIEPRAASVLRYRWLNVDLHADVRDVGRSNLAPVDVICGGFPCQDLSVAGKRRGLAGERSGLFYEFMRVVDALAPAWVLIENVPGLLSSNGGRDMGAVLGTLARLGYGWTYRCLDTQYFGPPQRRLRVFIVGRAGGFCPPEVLLEPEGLPWNPPPSREAREGIAPLLEVGARSKSGGRHGSGIGEAGDPMFTLQAKHQHGVTPFDTTQITSKANYSRPQPGDPCHPLAAGAHAPAIAHTLRSEGADASEDGTGRGTPLVAQTITALMYQSGGATAGANPGVRNVFAFDWQKGNDRNNPRPSTMNLTPESPTLSGSRKPAVTTAVPRRLTPRECERLQGWPDDWTRWGRTPDGEVKELSDSARYRMAGNGISKPVSEWIGHRISTEAAA